MTEEPANPSGKTFGTWQDAENLRRWSFLQRTPQQRLDWLVEALTVAAMARAAAEPGTPITQHDAPGR